MAAAGLRLPDEAVDDLYGDVNGERSRTEDWGFACLRFPELYRMDSEHHLVVSAMGDVGAATGALGCLLAARGWERGYATGPRALIWAGSDSGLRAAAVLQKGGSSVMPSVAINQPKTPVTEGQQHCRHRHRPQRLQDAGACPRPSSPFRCRTSERARSARSGFSTSVKIEGNAVAIRGATFNSIGDIASKATGGGLISANTHGITKFIGPGIAGHEDRREKRSAPRRPDAEQLPWSSERRHAGGARCTRPSRVCRRSSSARPNSPRRPRT